MGIRVDTRPKTLPANGAGGPQGAAGGSLTLKQVLQAVRIKVVPREGFNLDLLNRVRIAPPIMRAIDGLCSAGLRSIVFFPIHQEALEYVFSTPQLPGLLEDAFGKSQRAIVTQPLTAYLDKRGYQVLGNRALLEGLHLTRPVSDRLFAWDRNGAVRTLKFGKGVLREQTAMLFSSPELAGARLAQEGLFIDAPDATPPDLLPPETLPADVPNGVFAARLGGMRENYPELTAQGIRAAFSKPVPQLLTGMEGIGKMAESIEPGRRKPCREAMRHLLREQAERIIAHFTEDLPGLADQFLHLVSAVRTLESVDLIDALLNEAKKQSKFALFAGLVELLTDEKKLGPRIDSKDKARFHYLLGKLSEEVGSWAEANDCYAAAAALDPQNKTIRKAPGELKTRLQAEEDAIRAEFRSLWEKAAAEVKENISAVERQIRDSFVSLRPQYADEFRKFSSGDKGQFIKDIQSDCFTVAQKLKPRLLARPETVSALVRWLNQHPVKISQEVLKEIAGNLNSMEEKPAGYSLLFGITRDLTDESLQGFCGEQKDLVLNDFILRLSRARRFGFVEGFMLCIAIEEEGVIFPEQKPLLDKLIGTPQAVVGNEGFVALVFAAQIHFRLYAAPAARVMRAARQGDLQLLERTVREMVEASSEEEGNHIRVLQYCNAVDEFSEAGQFEHAETYIKKAQALDSSAHHVDRALASYYLYKKDFPKAAEHMEAALARTPRDETSPMSLCAVIFYNILSKEYEPDRSMRRALALTAVVYSINQQHGHNCYLAAVLCNALDERGNFLLWAGRFVEAHQGSGDPQTRGTNKRYVISDCIFLIDELTKALKKEAADVTADKAKGTIAAVEDLLFREIEEQKTFRDDEKKFVEVAQNKLSSGEREAAEKMLRLAVNILPADNESRREAERFLRTAKQPSG